MRQILYLLVDRNNRCISYRSCCHHLSRLFFYWQFKENKCVNHIRCINI